MYICLCSLCGKNYTKKRARGYMDTCTPCHRKERIEKWHLDNPGRKYELRKEWFKKNPEKTKFYKTKWSLANPETGTAKAAKYRAKKKQALPLWADIDAIKQIYINCPVGFEVDHIIPLQGKTVSGLHVENNLQYLNSLENKMKSNKLLEGNP